MSEDINYVGIQGNTREAGENATKLRSENKRNTMKIAFHVSIFLTLLAVGIILTRENEHLNFFNKCLVAVTFIFISNKLNGAKNEKNEDFIVFWPTVLSVIGWSTLFITLLYSGFGKWSEHVAIKTEKFFACAADNSSVACQDDNEESFDFSEYDKPSVSNSKIPTREQLYGESFSNNVKQTVIWQSDPVTSCDEGWTEIELPANTSFSFDWNSSIADYQWFNKETGDWQEQQIPTQNMRFCSKKSSFVGKKMNVTLTGYNL